MLTKQEKLALVSVFKNPLWLYPQLSKDHTLRRNNYLISHIFNKEMTQYL